ncbi:hypothetical protein MD484_g4583, partial [Candolleomyces efflorescens]
MQASIDATLKEEPDLLSPLISVTMQMQRLVYDPLKAATKKMNLIKSFAKNPYVIVLDAIDECEAREQVVDFIDQAVRIFKDNPGLPLRFLITGRIERHLQLRVDVNQIETIDLAQSTTQQDLTLYIRSHFGTPNWPSVTEVDALAEISKGSFAAAKGLVGFVLGSASLINFDDLTPAQRLQLVLGTDGQNMDEFYTRILRDTPQLPYFMDILSAIALLKTSLSISEISKFLGIFEYEVVEILSSIPTLVTIPGRDNAPISFSHPSLREFLLDEERSGPFYVRTDVLKEMAYKFLDAALVHYEGLSEIQWMLPLDEPIPRAIAQWPKNLDLILETDPSFDMSGLDTRYSQILSKLQVIPHFFDVIAIIASSDNPVPVGDILSILQLDVEDISLIIYGLTPILGRGPNKFSETLSLVDQCQFRHKSVRDFLLDPFKAEDLHISPTYYTHIARRHLSIVFGLPHSFIVDKPFFMNWPKYLALAVQHDPLFEREALQEPYEPVAPMLRAIESLRGWRSAFTVVLKTDEVAAMLASVEVAVAAVEIKIPGSFQNLDNLVTIPDLKDRNVTVSRNTVSVIDMLDGFRTILSDSTPSSRLCVKRGSGVGIQIEKHMGT